MLNNPGALSWIFKTNLIDMMLNAETELEEFQTEKTSLFERYRFQFPLDPTLISMDNTEQKNLDALLRVGQTFVQKFKNEISDLSSAL